MNPDSLTPESGTLTSALQFISHTEILSAFSYGVKEEIDWETCRFFCFSIILYIYFIIYFWLCWAFVAWWAFSSCRECERLSSCGGLLTAVTSLVAEHSSRALRL